MLRAAATRSDTVGRVHIYGLDIETDTTVNGLDPDQATIISVAVASPDGSVLEVYDQADETELLRSLVALLAGLEPGCVATWNGSGFDIAFLIRRLEIAGIAHTWTAWPSARLAKYEAVGGSTLRARFGAHTHADIAYAYRDLAETAGVAWSLKPVARHLGHDPVEVDRAATHLLTPEELHAYVASDAHVTALLTEHLGQSLGNWLD